MVRRLLEGLFARGRRATVSGRERLTVPERPVLTYAIGDVHGCYDELRRLERAMVEDARGIAGEKLIVMLGDYIDRGPHAAQVLGHLLDTPPEGFKRIALAGNHEQMLLDFLERPRNSMWLENGGIETMLSYGIAPDLILKGRPSALANALAGRMPESHLEFLAGLPVLVRVPDFVFVHAGLRSGISLEQQSDDDLLWTRDGAAPQVEGLKVVHGHTPVAEPALTAQVIGIDTAAFLTGRLTALRIGPSGTLSLIST